MEEQEIKAALLDVLTKHGVPDKSIVGKLPRGGGSLDFVGHAEITKILIEVDPLWSWQPCGWNEGRPAIHVVNGMAVMWGILTVHGKDIIGVGSVKHDKAELDKELIGDFKNNGRSLFSFPQFVIAVKFFGNIKHHHYIRSDPCLGIVLNVIKKLISKDNGGLFLQIQAQKSKGH